MGKTYPTAEERTRIIARREQLERALVEYLVTRSPVEAEARAQLNPLVREYGFAGLSRHYPSRSKLSTANQISAAQRPSSAARPEPVARIVVQKAHGYLYQFCRRRPRPLQRLIRCIHVPAVCISTRFAW
jgi:hypothetical protein